MFYVVADFYYTMCGEIYSLTQFITGMVNNIIRQGVEPKYDFIYI